MDVRNLAATDIHHEKALWNTQDSPFLSALAGFIKPVLEACVSATKATGPAESSESISRDLSDIQAGLAGQTLLSALQQLIKEALTEHRMPVKETSIPDTKEDNIDEEEDNAMVEMIPQPIKSQELPLHVHEEARRIVFNVMPIRLLTFDSSGETPRLVERNEILDLILLNVSAKLSPTRPEAQSHRAADIAIVRNVARYAILSHTWIRELPGDVVYHEWGTRERNPRGNAKITQFCAVAAQKHGVAFAWMDTVCINKESSTELDESIRSMYRWYRDAKVCVAYLSETQTVEDMHRDSWFTRGWTLQELLAPSYTVRFYNKDWHPLGARQTWMTHEDSSGGTQDSSYSGGTQGGAEKILRQIEVATSITRDELVTPHSLLTATTTTKFPRSMGRSVPFSRILQLAARRTVTREEDQVYSIMGLLNVEITIAYGEGRERALLRLLREALAMEPRVLDIFNHGYSGGRQLLPSDIHEYLDRSDVDFLGWKFDEPVIFTHIGIRVQLLLVPARIGRQHAPLGQFSGTVILKVTGQESAYSLLNKSIYEDPSCRRTDDQVDYGPQIHFYSDTTAELPYHAVFGALNFRTEGDNILLYPNSLCVQLECEIQSGVVDLSSNITIIPVTSPVVFTLERNCVRISKGCTVPKSQLAAHGMQLATIYLR